MKIKIQFGQFDGNENVDWYKPILDFPKLLKYQGNVYEFVMYNMESDGYLDYTCFFSQTKHYSINFWDIPTFSSLFRSPSLDSSCQCGAKHDKGNPNYHMSFCPKYKPKKDDE